MIEIAKMALALIVYTVAAFGLAYILGHAEISRAFREWLWTDYDADAWDPLASLGTLRRPPLLATRRLLVTLLECPACCGFWIGLASVFLLPTVTTPSAWWLTAVLVLPLYTCGANYLLARATGLTPAPGT